MKGVIRFVNCLVLLSMFYFNAHTTKAEQHFSVVTYNVHGLPSFIADDNPDTRIPKIPEIAAEYDVAVLQEVFNFRDQLQAGFLNHRPFTWTKRRGGFGSWIASTVFGNTLMQRLGMRLSYGSGLATFVREDYVDRSLLGGATFEDCDGWLGDSFDCWAAKGVVGAEIKLADGLKLHIYNTHLEAGNSVQASDTRKRQLDRIVALVKEHSPREALLFVGDLNLGLSSREKRAKESDRDLYDSFVTRLGLRDTEASGQHRRWRGRRNDYIFYRSGRDVGLRLLEAGEDLRFFKDGKPLSDHPALFAKFVVDYLAQSAQAVSH